MDILIGSISLTFQWPKHLLLVHEMFIKHIVIIHCNNVTFNIIYINVIRLKMCLIIYSIVVTAKYITFFNILITRYSLLLLFFFNYLLSSVYIYRLKCIDIEESSINRYDVSSFIIVINVTIYYLLKKKN